MLGLGGIVAAYKNDAVKNLAYGTNKYNIDPDDATPVRAAAGGD